MYVCVCVGVNLCLFICVCVYVYVYMSVYIRICVSVSVYICRYMYHSIYIYLFVCIYILSKTPSPISHSLYIPSTTSPLIFSTLTLDRIYRTPNNSPPLHTNKTVIDQTTRGSHFMPWYPILNHLQYIPPVPFPRS